MHNKIRFSSTFILFIFRPFKILHFKLLYQYLILKISLHTVKCIPIALPISFTLLFVKSLEYSFWRILKNLINQSNVFEADEMEHVINYTKYNINMKILNGHADEYT